MVGLPSLGAQSPPGFRRPVCAVQFGGSAGAPGGTDPWPRSLVSVTVRVGLAPSVDVVELVLAADEQAPGAAIGDAGSVSLGYEDAAAELVFTGQIEGVRHGTQGTTRISAANGGVLLSRLRVNQSYEQQAAGDIVTDLAGRAGVGTDTIEAGLDFAFYVVDDRSSAFQQIAGLARKSGYVASFTPQGDLRFGPFASGQPVQTFTYGQDILALQLAEASPSVGAVTAVGEGAAGSEGQEAWNWLIKDPSPVTGSAGEGEPARLISDPSLRSTDAAQSAAEGHASAAGLTTIIGNVLVPGAPAVIAGGAIEIVDAPQDAANGLCVVRRVRHRYSKREGFTTWIAFSKTGGGGAGGLL